MLIELMLMSDKSPGRKIDAMFGTLLALTNGEGNQLMKFGTLDTKCKELVMDILISVVSSSYDNMK